MAIVLWIQQRIHSLLGHLLITYVAIMLVVLGGVIGWTGRQLAAETILQAQDDLQLHAQIIANALREPIVRPGEVSIDPSTRSISDLLSSYAENIGGRVTLVDAQFKVIASSDARVVLSTIVDSPEFSSTHSDIRRDAPNSEERLYVAAQIPSSASRPLGFVQLSISMSPIYAAIDRKWLDLLGIGAVALGITILASLLLARRIAIPIQRLTMTSDQIASGRLEERVAPAGPNEVQRLGHAFNQMTERVQALLAQQREFVDNAAHELRSPLTSLRLRLDLLAEHGIHDPALTQQYVGNMQRDVTYLQRLVDHLLTLASVEEGEPAEKTPTDFAPVLREIAQAMALLIQQAQLTFTVVIPDHLPDVQANADQIRIAIRNLLDNAMKYTRAGGTITLSAQSVDGALEIRVTDTGIGIPADALPRVFDRFYRVDRSRARKQGGAGLGLALVRTMVETNGGTIVVASRVNEGSQFTVRLPVNA
jgi:two-component system, OmpR family, sensor kinase